MFPALLPRALVAVFGIPLTIGAAWLGGWWITAFASLVSVIGLWEFNGLAKAKGYPMFIGWAMAAGLVIVIGQQYQIAHVLAGVSVLLFLLFTYLVLRQRIANAIGRLGFTMLGVVYVPGLFAHMIALRQLDPLTGTGWAQRIVVQELCKLSHDFIANFGFYLLALTMALIWINDTAAYFVGMRLGKRRLAPAISPKKSVEGFAGGLIVTCGAAVALKHAWLRGLSLRDAIILGAGIVLIGTLGDLFESLLKRDAGIKDSGNILPGHGGILDRFDSLLFAAPFVYWYCRLFVMR
ncbi:MAG: phosphatidate cytidylyltransferase [Candidatus Edwardsbacteria bacterium]|nr:phosphatidate cytidylyltransferase [Candidatus Edwardsbacteria bacterium]